MSGDIVIREACIEWSGGRVPVPPAAARVARVLVEAAGARVSADHIVARALGGYGANRSAKRATLSKHVGLLRNVLAELRAPVRLMSGDRRGYRLERRETAGERGR